MHHLLHPSVTKSVIKYNTYLSLTADWGAGKSAQRRYRSTRGPEVPGVSHKFAGANPLETPPHHWGDPQGIIVVLMLTHCEALCNRMKGAIHCKQCVWWLFGSIPVVFVSCVFLVTEGQCEHRHRDGQHADCGQRWQHYTVSLGQPQEESEVCGRKCYK